jgi:hypothetical protein
MLLPAQTAQNWEERNSPRPAIGEGEKFHPLYSRYCSKANQDCRIVNKLWLQLNRKASPCWQPDEMGFGRTRKDA